MQTSNKGELPRRARYYQAAADIDTNNHHPYDDKTKKIFYNVKNQRKYTPRVLRGRKPLSGAGEGGGLRGRKPPLPSRGVSSP